MRRLPRRSTKIAVAVAVATAVIGVATLRADRERRREPGVSPDSTTALHVLAAARGTSPLACELIMSLLSTSRGGFELPPDAPAAALPHLHWIMQRSSDAERVGPLRRAAP